MKQELKNFQETLKYLKELGIEEKEYDLLSPYSYDAQIKFKTDRWKQNTKS